MRLEMSQSRRIAPRQSTQAFTLVELLVVIGIIAVLISLLLPALNRAREQAATVQCLSNIKQIVAGCIMYSNENKGIIIPMDCRDNAKSTSGAEVSGDWWATILVAFNYVSYPVGANVNTPSIFRCPSGMNEIYGSLNIPGNVPSSRTDQQGAMGFDMGSTYLMPGRHVYCWYGLNATTGYSSTVTANDHTIPIHREEPDGWTTPVWTKISSLHHSADLVFMYDGIFCHHASVNANRINARHERMTKTNLGFFDGHAETYNTAKLPGGIGDANNDQFNPGGATQTFDIKNLDAHYPYPHWRINQ